MKGKNYKIVSLYSFFPFQENLILDLKNKLLEINPFNHILILDNNLSSEQEDNFIETTKYNNIKWQIIIQKHW